MTNIEGRMLWLIHWALTFSALIIKPSIVGNIGTVRDEFIVNCRDNFLVSIKFIPYASTDSSDPLIMRSLSALIGINNCIALSSDDSISIINGGDLNQYSIRDSTSHINSFKFYKSFFNFL